LLNLLAGLSLLLCIASVGLWVRSYWVFDAVGRNHRDFRSQRGEFYFQVFVKYSEDNKFEYWNFKADNHHAVDPFKPFARCHSFIGFGTSLTFFSGHDAYGWWKGKYGYWPPIYEIYFFPIWFVTALYFALPLMRVASLLRGRERTKMGRCPCCAYDLRATPGRCRECGWVTYPGKCMRSGWIGRFG
jgi:hypothetical protein